MKCSISNCGLNQKKQLQIWHLLHKRPLPRPPQLVAAGEALLMHLAGRLLRRHAVRALDALTILTVLQDQLVAAAEELAEAVDSGSELPGYVLVISDYRYVTMTNMTSFLDLDTCTLVDELPSRPTMTISFNLTDMFIRPAGDHRPRPMQRC